ncbi:MAG: nucleotidyltransferase domain-containing protein [Oscillospiraceae bacterium]|nr:nucleotidyltransferase domain-containing protein [Oscillospiraceae bacterium]
MGRYAGVDLGNLVFNRSIAEEAATKLAPKKAMITRDEALKISADFATRVREQIDPEALVFVFGSTVRGTANINSDIDIAVVSKAHDADVIEAAVELSRIARDVSWDIEVHTVAYEDWRKGDPHVFEIQKWGIPI